MIKLVVFDLDETLIDTIEGLGYSANAVLDEYGLKGYDREFYEGIIGNGARRFIESITLDKKKEKTMADEMLIKFLDSYSRNWMVGLAEYDGVNDVIEILKEREIKIALNTNKPHAVAEKIVIHFYGTDTFKSVKGACEDYPKKPHPAGVNMILEELNIGLDECIYVGDSKVDIETSRNAGIKSIGVKWGYGKNDGITDADYIAENPYQLLEILKVHTENK